MEKKRSGFTISAKLNMSIAILVCFSSIVGLFSFIVGKVATQEINRIESIHTVQTQAISRMRANLLAMQGEVRGYLALSDMVHIDRYNKARERFNKNHSILYAKIGEMSDKSQNDLRVVTDIYNGWLPVIDQLFALHEQPDKNQPTARIALDLTLLYLDIESELHDLITILQNADISAANHKTLHAMHEFNNSLNAAFININAYAITGTISSRQRYGEAIVQHGATWRRIKESGSDILKANQERLQAISLKRKRFFELSNQIILIGESERFYEDLYIFRNEAFPQTALMLAKLEKMNYEHQASLRLKMRHLKDHLFKNQIQIITISVLVVFSGILMGFVFRKMIVQRIDTVITGIKEIESGNLDIEIPEDAADEIGIMARSFNRMTGKLNQTMISLEDKTQKAETANRAKSEFLSNMSHEIRTPMNAILGFTEILEGIEKDAKKRHYIDIVNTSAHALLNLINDILDMSKIEAGKVDLQYAAVSLESLFDEIVLNFNNDAEKKGLRFVLGDSSNIPKALLLDETRMRQILVNLVGNALKFTDTGHIRLSAEVRYAEAVQSVVDLTITVEDSGIGIPKDQQDKIFGAFEQTKGQKAAQFGGTGLGLAITRKLVKLMGGKISVTSQPGKGSVFYVTVPKVKIAAVEAFPVKKTVNVDFEYATILITDDIVYNREILADYLEEFVFDFIFAENGRECIEAARNHHPDLILLDMKMPVMDGYEACEVLNNDDELKDIPIVAITASALKQDENTIAKICSGYLRKPVRRQDLIAELMKHLPNSKRESKAEKTA